MPLVAGLLLAAGAGHAEYRNMHIGVPWDEVDWEELCKGVKPLKYTSSTGQVCPKVHPADSIWKKWHDPTGRGKPEPPWKCESMARRYDANVRTVGKCKHSFGNALEARALSPQDFDEPLEVWRARYFGPWLP
jgi:hypothetical protein